ncbi:hypothetical protein LB518_22865 [Mesorhizobium sp. BR1-1-16]|uniref:hypothetical protein n=1 Tax=Mesorhizobium sp. BR1-1-16 TaxID=2876653 RepID=UPI001CCD8592|nr:hypothetical protein [Mesorhizobium sp. BR1-1-16]MBZ9939157.1 hypothetical protein [Mesorhizobium sp. BR1-1-16]
MSKIDRLCDQLGIKIVPYRRRRRPRQTHARQVMRRIAAKHGDGHLLFVLKAILWSRNNTAELWSETILAVSDVVIDFPEWAEVRAGEFMTAFDTIDLAAVRRDAMAGRRFSKRCRIYMILVIALRSLLNSAPQGELL